MSILPFKSGNGSEPEGYHPFLYKPKDTESENEGLYSSVDNSQEFSTETQ